MKEQKVLCVKDYAHGENIWFKKGNTYTFTNNGIVDEDNYPWTGFLDEEGYDSFLKKWNINAKNSLRTNIFKPIEKEVSQTFNFKCDDFEMKEGYVLEMHSDSFTVNNKIGCPVYKEFEDGRWCHMKYGRDLELLSIENSNGICIKISE